MHCQVIDGAAMKLGNSVFGARQYGISLTHSVYLYSRVVFSFHFSSLLSFQYITKKKKLENNMSKPKIIGELVIVAYKAVS